MDNLSESQSEGENSDDPWITQENDALNRDGSSQDTVSRGRGRPFIQECWTRVINPATDKEEQWKAYPVATDLLVANGLPNQVKASSASHRSAGGRKTQL